MLETLYYTIRIGSIPTFLYSENIDSLKVDNHLRTRSGRLFYIAQLISFLLHPAQNRIRLKIQPTIQSGIVATLTATTSFKINKEYSSVCKVKIMNI